LLQVDFEIHTYAIRHQLHVACQVSSFHSKSNSAREISPGKYYALLVCMT